MKEINYKNLDWYVLEENEETTRLLLKNVLDEERIKKYCDDEWFRDGQEVRHSSDVRAPFNWENSYINNVILPNFVEDLGIECEATLLTKEEAENLPDEIRCSNDWYWTKTNASDECYTSAYVWYVNLRGRLDDSLVYSSRSVRPVIILKSSSNLKSVENEGKTPFTDISKKIQNCIDELNDILKEIKKEK